MTVDQAENGKKLPDYSQAMFGEYWHWYNDTRPNKNPCQVYYRIAGYFDPDYQSNYPKTWFMYRLNGGDESGHWVVSNILFL